MPNQLAAYSNVAMAGLTVANSNPYARHSLTNWVSEPLILTRAKIMQIKKGKFYLINAAGAIQSDHDTFDDAVSAAQRYAAKYDDEGFIFTPKASVRPKKDTILDEF